MQTQESMHMLLRTAKAEMSEKSKSFHFAPNLCTEKRSHSQFLPEKKMEKEMNIQNLRADTEDRRGDAASNKQERAKPPEVPWVLQGWVSSQAASDALTRGSELQSQLTFLSCFSALRHVSRVPSSIH